MQQILRLVALLRTRYSVLVASHLIMYEIQFPRQRDCYFAFIPSRIMVVLNWTMSLTSSFSSSTYAWGHTQLLARIAGRNSSLPLHYGLLIEPDLYFPVLHLLDVTFSSRQRRKTLVNNSKKPGRERGSEDCQSYQQA